MNKHTQGPWHWKTNSLGTVKSLETPEAHVLSVEEYAGAAWIELSEDDARLIAAAPDLLDALQMAKHIVANEGNDAQIKQVLDAIEKATGEKA